MPVGAGSIKRAAKLNSGAAESTKAVAKVETAAVTENAPQTDKEAKVTTKKVAEKKTAEKKITEKKATEKKTTEKKATAKSSAIIKKTSDKNMVSKEEVNAVWSNNYNQVCHLTEELPIHLL